MNKLATFFRESGLARFLIPLGIFLILFGAFMFKINAQNQDYIKTEATVSKVELAEEAYTDANGNRVEATYTVSVQYVVDGQTYEVELSDLPEHKVGEKMDIYYNPEDPSQITQTTSLILPIGIIAAGAAALVGGIVSALNAWKKIKRMKEQEKGWAKNG